MDLVLDIILLVVGLAGTGVAVLGETYVTDSSTGRKRLTRLGWIASACLVCALGLGIVKQVKAYEATKKAMLAAEEARKQRDDIQQSLRKAQEAEKVAIQQRDDIQKNLNQARERIASLKSDIVKLESGIMKDRDDTVHRLKGMPTEPLISGNSGRQIVLYGGDIIHYRAYGIRERSTPPAVHPYMPGNLNSDRHLSLGVEGYSDFRERILDGEHGALVMLPRGRPFPAMIRNPLHIRDLDIKITIQSSVPRNGNEDKGTGSSHAQERKKQMKKKK